MKNKYFPALIVFFFLSLLSILKADDTLKKKITISNFEVPSSALKGSLLPFSTTQESDILTKKLITSLQENPLFEIIKKPSQNSEFLIENNVQLIELKKQQEDPNELSGSIIISLRITDKATSKLICVKKITQMADVTMKENLNESLSSLLEKLNEKVICQLTTIIIETIFPIKIASIQGAHAILNNDGDIKLRRGTILNIIIPNVPVIDPKTNEVLKDSEYQIGELKIIETKPKLKAQILNYSIPLETGTLCRTVPECE